MQIRLFEQFILKAFTQEFLELSVRVKTSEIPHCCLKQSMQSGSGCGGKREKQRVQREGEEIVAGFMPQATDKPFRDVLMQSVALNQD